MQSSNWKALGWAERGRREVGLDQLERGRGQVCSRSQTYVGIRVKQEPDDHPEWGWGRGQGKTAGVIEALSQLDLLGFSC